MCFLQTLYHLYLVSSSDGCVSALLLGDSAEDELVSTHLPPNRHATLPLESTQAQSQQHIRTHSPTRYSTYPGQWHAQRGAWTQNLHTTCTHIWRHVRFISPRISLKVRCSCSLQHTTFSANRLHGLGSGFLTWMLFPQLLWDFSSTFRLRNWNQKFVLPDL